MGDKLLGPEASSHTSPDWIRLLQAFFSLYGGAPRCSTPPPIPGSPPLWTWVSRLTIHQMVGCRVWGTEAQVLQQLLLIEERFEAPPHGGIPQAARADQRAWLVEGPWWLNLFFQDLGIGSGRRERERKSEPDSLKIHCKVRSSSDIMSKH